MNPMKNTDPRTEAEIMAGVIPGRTSIILGGVAYPAVEPCNARARRIREAFDSYRAELATMTEASTNAAELLDQFFDTCLKAFSPEIENDWELIYETATDRERIVAMAIVKEAIMIPFAELAEAAPPVQNRAARRARK